MIYLFLKRIIQARGLSQSALAEVMGVKLQRVRDLCSGRAAKLTREEGEALIRKLHVRGDWLATGEGPMFQSEEEQNLIRLYQVCAARRISITDVVAALERAELSIPPPMPAPQPVGWLRRFFRNVQAVFAQANA